MHKIHFIKVLRVFVPLDLRTAKEVADVVFAHYSVVGPDRRTVIEGTDITNAFRLGKAFAEYVMKIKGD